MKSCTIAKALVAALRAAALSTTIAAALSSCASAPRITYPTAVAHRGCWVKDLVPENCPAGVYLAARYGFWAIECDVHYTADSVMVLMHDATINRTMRLKEGYAPIPEKVKVSETTFEELRTKYVLASDDPALRLPIPTFAEELEACKATGVIPMMHSSVEESYRLAKEVLGDGWICFMSEDKKGAYARSISDCLVLLDPGRDEAENVVKRLAAIGGRIGMSTMKHDMLKADYIKVLTDAGYETQSSIFPTPHEMDAIHDKASIILSDFVWFPRDGRKPSATWKDKDRKFLAGESVSYQGEALEYSGMTFSATFKGSVEIELSDGHRYTVTHEDYDTETMGLRLHGIAPAVKVTALEDSDLKRCDVAVYEIR